jgi:capsular exopolysaccharide synthesis family protein
MVLQQGAADAGAVESDGFNFGELWRALRRRQRLALLVGTGVAGLAFATTLWQRAFAPVYQGEFHLLVTDPISTQGGGGSSGASDSAGGGVIESLARNRTSIDFPTLVETLRSPMVLDPLRRQLGESGALLGGVSISQGGYSRRANANSPQGVLVVSLTGRRPSEIQTALSTLSGAYLNFALQQRQQQLNEGLNFLDQQEPKLQQTVNQLQGQLAEFRRRHNLLAPETEAAALKVEAAGMEQEQRQLEAERSRLAKLRQGVLAGNLNASSFSTGSSAGNSSNGAAAGVTVTQANSDLLAQLQSVEQQLSQARSTYRSDTPRVQTLSALRTRLAGQLRNNQLEALDTSLQLSATRLGTLSSQRNQVDGKFLKQPPLIKDYELIQQQLKVAQDNLANFLTTRSTFQLERAQNTVPWAVISPPRVQGFPVEPKLRDGLLKALLLGAVAGVGAAMLRDRLDHVFRSPGEARDELQQPLLGHIPHVAFFQGVRENSRFLLGELDQSSPTPSDPQADPSSQPATTGVSGYQRFFYQEAFRNLFTSLRFLNTGQNLRAIALSSSLPAEGKSLINVLLAKTLSEMGQRVLLVDADLRKPQIHHRLGLNNLVGLSNLLTEELSWQETLLRVEGYENWYVIPAGRRPPDPTRLLSSAKMKELVEQLRQCGQFDLVLFDTPPVLGLADAALVAEQVDGMILLISLDRVDRDLPKEAISRMKASGAPLLGIVTNSVKEESRFSGSSGYGRYGYGRYGQRYGYGGYGSYDYRTSYAYYGDAQEPNATDTETATSPRRTSPLDHLRNRGRTFMRWIDG